jgi:RNA polymerase sigma factor (sigma-70 family)
MVFIIDDDEAMRDVLRVLIQSVGMRAETYASAEGFLEHFDPTGAACLILDVRMPGMDGLELQQKLIEDRIDIPIVFLTGHGDMDLGVRVMKSGAVDCIAKPFREQTLLDSVKRAIEQDAQRRRRSADRAVVESRLASLTAREREILDLVIAGRENKAIASQLGLSHKTIEFHRSKILRKMQAAGVIDLVRMTLSLVPPETTPILQA